MRKVKRYRDPPSGEASIDNRGHPGRNPGIIDLLPEELSEPLDNHRPRPDADAITNRARLRWERAGPALAVDE